MSTTTIRSASELRTLLEEVTAKLATVEARIDAIKPAKGGSEPGPERRKLLEGGDTDALRELAAEYERLTLDREALTAQRDALHHQRIEAIQREASENLPGLVKKLAAQVATVERLQTELSTSRGELVQMVHSIHRTRADAQRGGHAAAGASLELARRTLAATPDFRIGFDDMAERLGVPRV